jgi:polysaccharide export outer membrane protein
VVCLLTLLACAALTHAQPSAPTPPAPEPSHNAAYILGVDDQVLIQVQDLEEIKGDHPLRVDMQGNIRLPIAGRVHVAGLTVEQTEETIRKNLLAVLREPEVTVLIAEYRSHPVSVLGSVRTPGVVQLVGKKSLSEVLSLAGGANPDAGNTIIITRRKETGPLPLPGNHLDDSGEFYIAKVSLKSLLNASNPQDNINIESGDVVTVPKGELVYVLGAVPKAGGYVLNEMENITVLQAISMAGGTDRFANQKLVEVLRPKAGEVDRQQITVDVRAMLTGKSKDFSLQANDILYVPLNGKKQVAARVLESMLGMGSQIGAGIAIYRP